jgi:O-antigen/teichoic acid export membrane protein
MDKLAQDTKKGMFWSLAENLSKQGLRFVIGVILARLLNPSDYGLVGMCAVLIALGNSFVDSGFGVALIRRKESSNEDLSTVFYFNIVISVLFYFILFVTAPYISTFFNQPQLLSIIRVLGLVIVTGSFSVIQRTILTKEINFKLQTKITVLTSIIAGGIGITFAAMGFGVWSLVIQSLSQSFLGSCFLWVFNKWRPALIFSKRSFKNLFAFGSKLLIADIVDTIYKNIYYVVIGKVFSASLLGLFTRAETTVSLFTNNITNTVKRVSYPVLAKLQDNDLELKSMYRRLVKNTMLFSCSLLFGLAASAKPFIFILIGEKWLPSAEYIQLLCIAGIFMPLTIFNLNGINVKGHSRLYMQLQIANKIMAVPVIIAGIYMGIKPMLIGFIVIAIIYYLINVYFSSRLIHYTMREQLKDLIPIFAVSGIVGLLMFGINYLELKFWVTFLIQIILGSTLTIAIYNFIRFPEYLNIQTKSIAFIKSKLG